MRPRRDGGAAPRNGFGQPDFSGTWTNASITQLERPAQFKSLVITPAEAKTLEQGYAKAIESDAAGRSTKLAVPSGPAGHPASTSSDETVAGTLRMTNSVPPGSKA